MNFAAIKAEFGDRGFDYLEESRQNILVNEAYRYICNLHIWPFVVTTATGSADAGSVTVTDLRRILLVADTTSGQTPGLPLRKATYEELVLDGCDLAQTGTPEWYYRDGSEATTSIKTWPLGGTIFVRYAKRITAMSADADEPVFDEEYHSLIVDRAAVLGYLDNDNPAAAKELQGILDDKLALMAEDYQIVSREVSFISNPNPY